MSIGIIGGTGLYDLDFIKEWTVVSNLTTVLEEEHDSEVTLDNRTPFGIPSAVVKVGKFQDQEIVFIPRHSTHHRYLPSTVPYAANIWLLKKLGVRHIISVSAVGSLQEGIRPGTIVIPHDYIDNTFKRRNTFFNQEYVVHVSMNPSNCKGLRIAAELACRHADIEYRPGVYMCMEGPSFSTRAESLRNKQYADVIGMTAMPEARLAREAQMHYTTIACVTDYDCWKDDDVVSVDAVNEVMSKNNEKIKKVLERILTYIANGFSTPDDQCGCRSTLDKAILSTKPTLEEAKAHPLYAPLFL